LTSYLTNIPPHGQVRLWDVPGAGDMDVPAVRVLEMLESTFSNRTVHCVLLLTSRTDRMPLGAQLVVRLMDLCFASPDKWSCVALVGTKSDKYDDGDAEHFAGAVLQEFNCTVQGRISKVTSVNYHDVQPVRDLLAACASQSGIGRCKKPQGEHVANILRSLNGLKEEDEQAQRQRIEQLAAEREAERQKMEALRRENELKRQQLAEERETERQRQAARERERQKLEKEMRLANLHAMVLKHFRTL